MWKTVKLADIATVIAGQSPKGEHFNKEGRGTPFYQGKKDYGERYLNEPAVWTDVVTKLAEKDDILMSVRAPVGALNIATQKICIGRGLAAIRPSTEILHDYLLYSLLLISHQVEGSAGAIFNSINKTQIEAIEISLPPLAEQQRIVAKLDTAFAEIDGAITTSYKQLNNLESLYKKSLLSLFKVGIEKEMWELKPLQNYCDVVVGYVGEIASAYREPNNGVLLLSTTNIKSKGISLAKTKTVSFEFHERNKKSQLKPGDILVARHGNSGEAAEITSDIKEAQALNVIIIKKGRKIESAYLVLLLNSKVLSQIGESKAGSVQQIINTKVIKDLMIPAPPMERQVEIIGELRKLSSKVEQFKGLLNGKIVKYQTLKSAILAQELQPQKIEAA